MLEVKTREELEALFSFPLITRWKNQNFFDATFRFTNLGDGSQHSVLVNLNQVPTVAAHVTFNQLKPYLAQNALQDFDTLFASVLETSRLYEHSAHKLEVILNAEGMVGEGLTLTRYFIVPAIQSQALPVTIPMEIDSNILNYAFTVPTLKLEKAISRVTTKVIVRTKWTDIVLHDQDDFENKTFVGHINVAGFDMSQLIVFVVGNEVNQEHAKLIGYNAIDQSMILIPNIETKRGRTFVEDGKKKFEFSTRISSEAFNGLEYVDFGSLFFRRGIKLKVDGLPAAKLLLDKRVGT